MPKPASAPALTPAAWLRQDAIRRGLEAAAPRRVLEVGTGEGAMAWRLAQCFDYTGLEPDAAAYAVARRRLDQLGLGRILAGTTETLSPALAAEPFDLICAFEVLEHVEDDAAELARWHAMLRPCGCVLLSVPAHRSRFAAADAAVGHCRRYDRADLQRALEEARFDVVWIETWGAVLGHSLEAIRNLIAARGATAAPPSAAAATARSGRWLQPRGRIVGWLAALAAQPFRLLQHPARHGEFGIGWVALARRTG